MDDGQLDAVWQLIVRHTTVGPGSIHGPTHWADVERNGLYISEGLDADIMVVRLFAVLHDCMRVTDARDDGHGPRAAAFAREIRDHLPVDDAALELLCHACTYHTTRRHHDDITIGICWDADRLDLPRAGFTPEAHFFNTPRARSLVEHARLFELASAPRRRTGRHAIDRMPPAAGPE